jgi:guanylate kinase
VQRPEPVVSQPPPLLVVLSGPSGAGKDAVLTRIRELGHRFHFTVTATTRTKRPLEQDGKDYIFLTPHRFDRMVEQDDFLEWAQVYGHRYGVPRKQVRDALKQGLDTLIKADVQGAATVRSIAPDSLLIFLVPPNLAELEPRLRQRKTEGDVDLELRLRTARAEMGHAPMFDYVVVNHDGRLDETVQNILSIITAEKHRTPPRRVEL